MQGLLDRAQEGLSLWDELLRTTGGSLEIDVNKTDFVAIDYASKNGILTMRDAQVLQPLKARDTNGIYQSIKQLKIVDARKTLGIYQAPTGSEDAQFNHMVQTVAKWTSKIKRSSISRWDIRFDDWKDFRLSVAGHISESRAV